LHLFSCFWGAQYIWVNPLWRLKITGRDKTDNRQAFVMISNHQSLVDIIVIYSIFRHFRWTSKAENFRLPFVGWVLSLNRSIKIYRGRKEAFFAFRDQALKALSEGNSIMVFPEGTRSRDGNPGRFRDGAFRIALEAGVGILPMVLDGTSSAIPKSGWSLRGRQEITLDILDPVPYSEFKGLDHDELRRKFEDLIHDHLAKRSGYEKESDISG